MSYIFRIAAADFILDRSSMYICIYIYITIYKYYENSESNRNSKLIARKVLFQNVNFLQRATLIKQNIKVKVNAEVM